ncbi:RluA family pseudouridine synthase [Neisseria sp. Ec49-e6-T10]|uniref:RluA family pseudouridine synthase n=1 Tax=Neisseria sp. Ec49-e6-T10 TaxID=3140744 RepID=UPI003EC0E4C1
MTLISKDLVNFLSITSEDEGQRLDNFLFRVLKGVPKSHIYRIIRSGEVRLNKKRAKVTDRLNNGDEIRIPPIRIAHKTDTQKFIPNRQFSVVYEDDFLLVIDKPAGVAVHGGSGVNFGVIEQLRKNRPQARYLELVHRLDRETSGLLMIAKKRSTLVKLHEYLRQHTPKKEYIALGVGQWNPSDKHVKLPLFKFQNTQGEKFVKVDQNKGQYAHTVFEPMTSFDDFTLLNITLKTGRTHQIRVHMQALGHPIAHDEKYGDFELNKQLEKQGLKRMFLHAHSLTLPHPVSGEEVVFHAPLPQELLDFLETLKKNEQ